MVGWLGVFGGEEGFPDIVVFVELDGCFGDEFSFTGLKDGLALGLVLLEGCELVRDLEP